MRSKTRLYRGLSVAAVALFGIFLLTGVQTAFPQAKKPLNLAQILTGLQAKSEILDTLEKKNKKIADDVKQRGITFKLIPLIEAELRNVGASDLLIEAIRSKNAETAAAAATPQPTPETADRPPARNAVFYFNRGETHRKGNRLDQAIADYDQALKLNPQYVLAYYYRGYCRNRKGELEQAVADYSKAIGLRPDFEIAYTERGKVHNRMGNFDLALADYSTAVELNPKSPFAFYERGLTYFNLGNYERAIEDATKAIELKPDLFYAYVSRGLSYKRIGNYDRAIADYNRAIELNPKYAIGYHNRGAAYQQRARPDDYKRAAADYRQALKLEPNLRQSRENLDIVLTILGEDGNSPSLKTGAKTISGGVLNGKATFLPKPEYPAAARAVGAGGSVNVQVLIDETGRVISAAAVSGHPLLKGSAVEAARRARFAPTKLSGEPVKVRGIIIYTFDY